MTVQEREEDEEEDLRSEMIHNYDDDEELQKSRSPCQYVFCFLQIFLFLKIDQS